MTMREMLRNSKPYTLVILRKTPKSDDPGVDKIDWENARRNSELRRNGKLCVVCPVTDDSDGNGIGILSTDVKATRGIWMKTPMLLLASLCARLTPVNLNLYICHQADAQRASLNVQTIYVETRPASIER